MDSGTQTSPRCPVSDPAPSSLLLPQENPYVMRRPNFQALSGNERFEGFCVDMLRELAELLRFRYRLRLVEDGLYGAPEPNGSWTGMVGELINRVRRGWGCGRGVGLVRREGGQPVGPQGQPGMYTRHQPMVCCAPVAGEHHWASTDGKGTVHHFRCQRPCTSLPVSSLWMLPLMPPRLCLCSKLRRERIYPQCGRSSFNPWGGKIHWRREWLPTPVFLPGKSHGQRLQSMGLQRVRHD